MNGMPNMIGSALPVMDVIPVGSSKSLHQLLNV